MFKKSMVVLTLAIIISSFSINVYGQAASNYIDKSKLSSGIVSINYASKNKSAVRIVKGNQKQDYILNGNDNFPLQFGDGEYTITVLENAGGNKYKQIEKEVFTLKTANKNDVYLQSIQMINWNSEMNSVKKAKELTKNAKTDKEKVTAIYNYIVNNVSYDYNKAKTTKAGYIPSIDEILASNQAICYDYSSLMAGMLRSINIPTKLVMGRNSEIKEYHAWNEVYLNDIAQWVIIDTTYDAGMKKGNTPVSMIKDENQYKIEKQY